MNNRDANIQLAAFTSVVAIGLAAAFCFDGGFKRIVGGFKRNAAANMQMIQLQVAKDAMEQYRIAKRSGTQMDAYVHAGLVAAACLQAKDEENYKTWKEIEAEEGRRAGIPAELLH